MNLDSIVKNFADTSSEDLTLDDFNVVCKVTGDDDTVFYDVLVKDESLKKLGLQAEQLEEKYLSLRLPEQWFSSVQDQLNRFMQCSVLETDDETGKERLNPDYYIRPEHIALVWTEGNNRTCICLNSPAVEFDTPLMPEMVVENTNLRFVPIRADCRRYGFLSERHPTFLNNLSSEDDMYLKPGFAH